MAKVTAKPNYLLELSESEAEYLKTLVQNAYLYNCNTEDEPSEEAEIRSGIYEALDAAGVALS